jgi:murein DD-endopeptidase MepM/ murein hydrolase activator NlpD
MQRSPFLVAAAALAMLLPGRAVPQVDAAAVAPRAVARPSAAIVEVTSGISAVATAPAQRLRKFGPPNFPMQPTPRCDVLDNFGDPRSGGRSHAGSDMLATLGQEVYAMADGTLTHQTKVGDGSAGSSLSGNLWKLDRADGTYYVYAHLSAFAPGLSVGSKVYRGQLIGYVGDTGNPGAGNYHLHFEIHPLGGAAVNPLPLLTIPTACRVY